MPRQRDYLLGKIALREGLVTREQLFDCLETQEHNPAKALGEIMVQRGYMRRDDITRLLDMQKHAMEDPPQEDEESAPGIPFGKILLEKGLATEYQVNECLRLQGRFVEMGIKPVPMLGDILIRRGYVKPGAIETALQFQNLSLYACPECGASIQASKKAEAEEKYTCGSCGVEVPAFFAKMAAAVGNALQKAAEDLDIDLPEEVKRASRDSRYHFGKYVLVEEIGRGGTGIVYKAWQKDLNKMVALKLLPHESDTAAGIKTPYGDAEDVKRFYNETRAAADLQHPNIIPILDFGTADSHFFFTMKFIEGTTLDDIIREGGEAYKTTLLRREEFRSERVAPAEPGMGLSPEIAFRVMQPLINAAAYAHDHGIFHRDIKPGNIIVDKTGHPWLMDFGLAKVTKIGDSAYVKGVVMGTPYYMPPEQAAGDMEMVDHLSDIYSLGAVLYELISGSCPYAGKSADEVLDLLESTAPTPLRGLVDDLPENAVRIIEKAMRRNKKERYPFADDLEEDIRLFLAGEELQEEPKGARPTGLIQKFTGLFRKKRKK